MPNCSDPDQAQQFVRPDLGPNCLQRLSVDETGSQKVKAAIYEMVIRYKGGPQIRVCSKKNKKKFLFSNKTYVVGTQKNRLDETVLLST